MSQISTSTKFNQKNINTFTWPITIIPNTNSKPIKITFESDIVFTSPNNYFIVQTENVIFNGKNNSIILSKISGYTGLIYNGFINEGRVITTGFSNVILINIKLVSNESTQLINSFNGWLCQSGYSNSAINNSIINCHIFADVVNDGGCGFCGYFTANNNGNLSINKCSFNGNILGQFSGGFLGPYSCLIGGNIFIYCSNFNGKITKTSTGSSGFAGPYICATYPDGNGIVYTSGTLIMDSCKFKGDIDSDLSSGFIGYGGSNLSGSSILLYGCKFDGNINSYNCGGFVGYTSAYGGLINIYNCSFLGKINPSPIKNQGGSGGIIGPFCCAYDGTINILNCLFKGEINQEFSGGIAGSSQITPIFLSSNSLIGNLNISNSIVIADIESEYSGGFIGCNVGFGGVNSVNNGTLSLSNCVYEGIIKGSYSAGLISGFSLFPTIIQKWTLNNFSISNTFVNTIVQNINSNPLIGQGLPINFYEYAKTINNIKINPN